jgi:hypothetical protein
MQIENSNKIKQIFLEFQPFVVFWNCYTSNQTYYINIYKYSGVYFL